MGNTATNVKRDRNFSYSIDGYPTNRDSTSPRSDDLRTFEFKKKNQFLYNQPSVDYSEDGSDEYKVGQLSMVSNHWFVSSN